MIRQADGSITYSWAEIELLQELVEVVPRAGHAGEGGGVMKTQRYPLPNLPAGFQIIRFEIRRGVGWRLAYWARRLFCIQLPIRFRGYVVKLKD